MIESAPQLLWVSGFSRLCIFRILYVLVGDCGKEFGLGLSVLSFVSVGEVSL